MDTVLRDPDLVDQYEKVRGLPGSATLLEMLGHTQAERDADRQLSPVARRRAQTRKHLTKGEFQDADRHHLHSVLALCALPYREPQARAREYVREYGKNSLAIQAGFLKDPNTGKMVQQGMPYGPKARLLLLHICTMAVRQSSPIIDIADSLSAFIRDMGFTVTGGARGTLNQFKEQLNRLAAARMQIGLWRGERSSTLNTQPIRSFEVWLPRDPDQRVLWTSQLRLDQEFYDSLREHALPVDIRALRAFSQSAKQIDLVLWLGYRLRNLERPYPISWSALKEQFGADVAASRKFKQGFLADLKAVQEVYPNLGITANERGLVLRPGTSQLFFPGNRPRNPG